MTESDEQLAAWASAAVNGDRSALERVVKAVENDIYRLALRMLWHPADAEDASQEILVRVVTSLDSFQGRSRLRTWVYRIAVRALLNYRRARVPDGMSFDAFGEDLRSDLDSGPTPDTPEQLALTREVKIGCTQAMLLCLDRDHRIAFLLGEVVQLSGEEAALCLDIGPATYRKRCERARGKVREFLRGNCGLVNSEAPCRCAKRVKPAIAQGRVSPKHLLFAEHPVSEVSEGEASAVLQVIHNLDDELVVLRSNPAYRAPKQLAKGLSELLGKKPSLN